MLSNKKGINYEYLCTKITAMKSKLDKIEDAIEDIKLGKVIIVVDDEDRENEGDFIAASDHVSPEMINFMITHGRGLVCSSLLEDRCDELELDLMVRNNNAAYETPFTVSVDLLGHGCTTGISTSDRAKTVKALVDPNTRPDDLGRPGHIFPLRAKKGGVLRRPGHTEATVDFARLAGLNPAGVLVEILNEDGTMARLPQLFKIAERFDLKIVSIADLISYRLDNETLIDKEMKVKMPTKYGAFNLHAFKQKSNDVEHFALVKGEWEENEPILVRVHSSSMLSDVFGSEFLGKGEQLHRAMEMIEKEGKGVIVYINKYEEHSSVIDELKNYQKLIKDNKKAQPSMDSKDYGIGAQILREIGVRKIKLLSNNPVRRTGIMSFDLEIVESVGIELTKQEL